MSVGQNIRVLRDKFGLTQDELADKLGVTRESVHRWETDKMALRDRHVARMVELFGIDPDDITSEKIGLAGPDRGILDSTASSGAHSPLPSDALSPVPSSAMVPLRVLGATHAGDPAEEIGDERLVEVPEGVARRHPQAFMLRVEGDCMDRSYPDGCLVMVDPTLEPWNGCAVVAEPSPGESVLRRYMRGQSSLMLVADSFGEHEDMVFTGDDADVRLLGTVVWFQASREETRQGAP